MLNTEDDVSKKNLFGAAFFGWYQHPASNEGVSTKKLKFKISVRVMVVLSMAVI